MHRLGREPQGPENEEDVSPGGATDNRSSAGAVAAAAGGFEDDAVARFDLATVDARDFPTAPVGADNYLAPDGTVLTTRHPVRRTDPVLAENRKLERREKLDLPHQTVAAAPSPGAA